ncbi:transmembrane amino acid transporter protein-domain-containing protein [Phascolomyces articulosus]|uniref:Transmembrane amino acid transporter protein-domain-containing protein n=1 Tax=Phascolomyces articulosus TaxID=60185 RepID=A0AAD5JR89_9FUNG|nr:transmembrane amino acid transporter protein-domain-containing protein [Phascolomyces articulosus]
MPKIAYFTSESSLNEQGGVGFHKNGYDIDRSNGGSSWFAYYNIVCLTLGTGMLGLPGACARGGWGAVALIIIAMIMSAYSGVILQPCMYKGKERRLSSYKEIAEEAFGKIGGWVSFFFTTWIIVGTPITYVVLAAQNINQLCVGTAGEIGMVAWTIIWTVMVGIPYIFIKSINKIAWVSGFGAIAMTTTIIITVALASIDAPNQVAVHHDNVIWEGFPVALATIAFGAGGNIVYANTEGQMKNPKQWPIVIIASLATLGAVFVLLAVGCYYVYGVDVVNPAYNSVPDVPARTVAIILVTINVIVSIPILLVPFAADLSDMMNITVERFGNRKEFIIRSLLRTAILVLIVQLYFILPILFYWRLSGFCNKHIIELAWGVLTVLFGLVGLIFGTWAAVEDLVKAFENGYEYKI